MGEYRGGATPGGKIGCGVAACVGLPLTGAVCIAAALGDCAPGVVCRRDVDWAFLAGALAIAAGAGLIVRALANRIMARRGAGR